MHLNTHNSLKSVEKYRIDMFIDYGQTFDNHLTDWLKHREHQVKLIWPTLRPVPVGYVIAQGHQ